MTRCDVRAEIAVRRGHDAHVGAARARLAEPFEVLVLEEAQQLRLERRRDLGDLVEKERAAFRRLDATRLIAHRAREGAARVAEQLAREQLGGERGTVHGDEGAVAPRALRVQRARQHALAGAALAAQQDRSVRRRGARNRLVHRTHGGRLGREIHLGHALVQLRFELEDAAAGVPRRCDLVHRVADLLGREWFGQVVLGSALHRLDGRVDGRVGRDHDHRETRLLGQQPRQQVEPARGAEAQVQEREVVWALRERCERGVGVGRFAGLAAQSLEADAQGHADVLVVVDDQHAQGRCQRLLRDSRPASRQDYRSPA